jgi:hypothetical protein
MKTSDKKETETPWRLVKEQRSEHNQKAVYGKMTTP